LVEDTLVARFNDATGLQALFAEHGTRISAVIVEPVVGNMGCVPPEPGFLAEVIRLCESNGAISIFDEVMTGCRLARGGAQELFGLRPHMTCLGKIVGGGMPLAVYGGQRRIMECVAPLGPVYQAGTLSGNPLSVTAGMVTLSKLDSSLYAKLERLGARLEAGLNAAIKNTAAPACVQRVGSMLTLFFQPGPVRNWEDASLSDTRRFAHWHRAMMDRHIYWPPAQFEAAFISGAHNEADIDRTVVAAAEALQVAAEHS
jgi:glutamate-1-semialdehyde 2,1-aminomutase